MTNITEPESAVRIREMLKAYLSGLSLEEFDRLLDWYSSHYGDVAWDAVRLEWEKRHPEEEDGPDGGNGS